MTTNVPQPIFGDKGYEAPAESAIQDGVMSDIDAAFGGGMNLSSATPQGQLGTSMTAAIGAMHSMFLLFTNLIDPAFSFGRMQDALGRIYFISRIPATATTVSCTCAGKVGVTIDAGSLVQDSSGNIYASVSSATIGIGGVVNVTFACQTLGPIVCPVGAISTIYKAVAGWDSVTNETAGVTGRAVETPSEFETRRAQSVAGNSRGSVGAIKGAVLSVDGVIDAFVYENATSSAVTYRGVNMLPNSIYVCVVGGTDEAVASAIWSKKAPGCVYNGTTQVTVFDTSEGYSAPYPEYAVKFQRPVDLPIAVAVTISDGAAVPSDAEAEIQGAIVGAFSGADGGDPAHIGANVYASRFYSPVAGLGAWPKIVSMKVGSINHPSATFTGSISGTTLTVASVASGTISVGDYVASTAGTVSIGTIVAAQISGVTGGAGAYQVSIDQTVASSTIKSFAADRDVTSVNMNQYPSISSKMISVALE